MKKISLKLFEILDLKAELSGVKNQETGEVRLEGLLAQKLPITTVKYWLDSLVNTLTEEEKSIESVRQELVKQYGKENDKGEFFIPVAQPKQNPEDENEPLYYTEEYIKFMNEYNEFLTSNEKEISVKGFKLEDLKDVNTTDNYPLVYKHLVIAPIEEPSAEVAAE